jgi:DNA-binding CsgD family transcriptional regulator
VGTDRRYAYWVDLVADLSTQLSARFPHARLLEELSATFGSLASWNWQGADGTFAFDVSHPINGWPPRREMAYWSELSLNVHPLLSWYRTTMDPRPFSIGRVPQQLVPRSGFALTRALLSPVGLEEQLSIPYAFHGRAHYGFVLAQSGQDFDDADVELAGRIQPLLAVLDRQSTILSRMPGVPDPEARRVGLTGREGAVLQLLAQGMTAHRIGSVLGISPRTVHTHLAHLYRKLGVGDRLQAVMTAAQLGLTARSVMAGGPSDGVPIGSTVHPPERPTQAVFGGAME